MRSLALRRSIAIASALVALAGCQAPGFMGLSGQPTSPESQSDNSRMVRARFRVLLPPSLAQGVKLVPSSALEATRSGTRYDDRAIIGARVFLDGQPTITDTTDDLGFASLAVPQGRLTPVRAEFKTSSGTVSMTGLVLVGSEAQSAPVFPITLASTLVMSKIAQRFKYSELKYLPYDKIRSGTEAVDQAIRTPDGSYDPRYMPNLARQWSVLDTAQTIVRLDPILNRALADVLSTEIPAEELATKSLVASASTMTNGPATSSISTASISLKASLASATLSATLSASASGVLQVGDLSLFAADMGQSWTYDLFDASGKPKGSMVRRVSKVMAKSSGVLFTGAESGEWTGDGNELRFLMRRSPGGIQFAAAYRPSVDYPLPLAEAQAWQAAPGITAIAHAPATSDASLAGSWRIDFTRHHGGQTTTWSEWLAPGLGFTRIQWVDPRTGHLWDARLRPAKPPGEP